MKKILKTIKSYYLDANCEENLPENREISKENMENATRKLEEKTKGKIISFITGLPVIRKPVCEKVEIKHIAFDRNIPEKPGTKIIMIVTADNVSTLIGRSGNTIRMLEERLEDNSGAEVKISVKPVELKKKLTKGYSRKITRSQTKREIERYGLNDIKIE